MRKTAQVLITADGRDKGKLFILREMPASQAEAWATRALTAAARSNTNLVASNVLGLGFAGLAVVGIHAFMSMDYADAGPLLDEMFTSCVAYAPDPNNLTITRGAGGIGPLVEDDIEEVATRVHLRQEIFALHVGFSLADGLRNLISANPPAKDTSTTKTSRRRSGR